LRRGQKTKYIPNGPYLRAIQDSPEFCQYARLRIAHLCSLSETGSRTDNKEHYFEPHRIIQHRRPAEPHPVYCGSRFSCASGILPHLPIFLSNPFPHLDNFGFLRLELSKTQIVGTYFSAPYSPNGVPAGKLVESFSIDLGANTVQTLPSSP
jgi:hypothetical protein